MIKRIAVLLALCAGMAMGQTASSGDLVPKIDLLVSNVSEVAAELGWSYAVAVHRFEDSDFTSCDILVKLDRIRDHAGYKLDYLEAETELRIMRSGCKARKARKP